MMVAQHNKIHATGAVVRAHPLTGQPSAIQAPRKPNANARSLFPKGPSLRRSELATIPMRPAISTSAARKSPPIPTADSIPEAWRTAEPAPHPKPRRSVHSRSRLVSISDRSRAPHSVDGIESHPDHQKNGKQNPAPLLGRKPEAQRNRSDSRRDGDLVRGYAGSCLNRATTGRRSDWNPGFS